MSEEKNNFGDVEISSSGGGTGISYGLTLQPPTKYYVYAPQADITAYELAQIMPALICHEGSCLFIEGLPEECRRHFREVGR